MGASLVWGFGYFSKSGAKPVIENNANQNQSQGQKVKGATSDDENPKAIASIGDDPVLGDKTKAKVAIVEFSDYECPYCKKFHDQTFDQIVKDYVETGKAVIVFKDFPLEFHKPAAIDDADSAETVEELAGDIKYFEYGKLLYANSGLNGKGLPKEKYAELAEKVGIDKETFNKTLESNKTKYEDEINKDIEEGKSAGVTGTPGFVVGKLDTNGIVDGELVTGALPYSDFKKFIEKQLASS